MSYALAERVTERTFEVFCVDCRCSIGTMTGSTLQAAIVANVGKGGVKCPACRRSSCSGCGAAIVGGLGGYSECVCCEGQECEKEEVEEGVSLV